jgi:hypothetical protein
MLTAFIEAIQQELRGIDLENQIDCQDVRAHNVAQHRQQLELQFPVHLRVTNAKPDDFEDQDLLLQHDQ